MRDRSPAAQESRRQQSSVTCVGVYGGNARMITCDSLVYQPFQPTGSALACDGVSIQSIVEHVGHADLHLQRARDPRTRIARSTTRSRRTRTRSTTRSRRTRRWRSCACCDRSAAARMRTPAARSASRERAGFAPPDIVFTGVGKTRDELEYAVAAGRRHDQRRIGRRARSHRGHRARAGPRGARRAARQSRHRSPGAIRTSPPASRRTSSASPLQEARAIYRDAARAERPAVRRRAHPHRLADHHARAAHARGEVARVARARAAR